MGLVDASILTSSSTAVISANPGDMILVHEREVIASPANPSGTGLPGFTECTLTAGNANNGANTVRGVWYRTKCGISFSGALAFANSTFGYEVYVYSDLVTTGTNGADAVLQAVGMFASAAGSVTITYTTPIVSGNRGVLGLLGGTVSGNTIEPTVPRGGWTSDFSQDDNAGTTIFGVALSRSTTDTAAGVTFNSPVNLVHGIALELQVATAPPAVTPTLPAPSSPVPMRPGPGGFVVATPWQHASSPPLAPFVQPVNAPMPYLMTIPMRPGPNGLFTRGSNPFHGATSPPTPTVIPSTGGGLIDRRRRR